jgi:hypothetical protein
MVLDPLGAQALCRPAQLLGQGHKDVLGESTSYFSDFTRFLLCCTILILSCTQEYFRLAEGITLEVTNIVFITLALLQACFW